MTSSVASLGTSIVRLVSRVKNARYSTFFLVFALGLLHRFGFQFFDTPVEFDKHTPGGQ